MVKKKARKPSYNQIRWLCQIIAALIILMLPIAITLRLVLAFLFALIVAIVLLTYRITRVAPWQLEQLKYPNPKAAFIESLLYTFSSFGLLVYLIASEHNIVHFACGFLGIISAWLAIQLIYSQEYAVRYYYDGKGLVFPDCDRPNWTEFLYQGFCMAACYQTSDTSINSTAMRQLVATHGMLSYFLSVSIIAIIFGIIGNLL
jgi:uncharacterized membrane protein